MASTMNGKRLTVQGTYSLSSSLISAPPTEDEERKRYAVGQVIEELYKRVKENALRDPKGAFVAHHSMYEDLERFFGFSMEQEVALAQQKREGKMGSSSGKKKPRAVEDDGKVIESDLLMSLNAAAADAAWQQNAANCSTLKGPFLMKDAANALDVTSARQPQSMFSSNGSSDLNPAEEDNMFEVDEIVVHLLSLNDMPSSSLEAIAVALAEPFQRATWRQSEVKCIHKKTRAAFVWVATHIRLVLEADKEKAKEVSAVANGASTQKKQAKKADAGSTDARKAKSKNDKSGTLTLLEPTIQVDAAAVAESPRKICDAVLRNRFGDANAISILYAELLKAMGIACDVVSGIRKSWFQSHTPWAWNVMHLPRSSSCGTASATHNREESVEDIRRYLVDVAAACLPWTAVKQGRERSESKRGSGVKVGLHSTGSDVSRIEVLQTQNVRHSIRTLLSNRTKHLHVTTILEVHHGPPPLFSAPPMGDENVDAMYDERAQAQRRSMVPGPSGAQRSTSIQGRLRASVDKNQKGSSNILRGLESFYFKTHPLQFAAEHFCDEDMSMMLLQKPVGRTAWNNYPHLGATFFLNGLKLDSHCKRYTINAPSTPFFIQLRVEDAAATELWCAVYRMPLRQLGSQLATATPLSTEWVWQQREEVERRVTFSIMTPDTGVYSIVIGARRFNPDSPATELGYFLPAVAYEVRVGFTPKPRPMYPRQWLTPALCKLVEPLAGCAAAGVQRFVVMPSNRKVMAVAIINEPENFVFSERQAAQSLLCGSTAKLATGKKISSIGAKANGKGAAGVKKAGDEEAAQMNGTLKGVSDSEFAAGPSMSVTILPWNPTTCAFDGDVEIKTGEVQVWVLLSKTDRAKGDYTGTKSMFDDNDDSDADDVTESLASQTENGSPASKNGARAANNRSSGATLKGKKKGTDEKAGSPRGAPSPTARDAAASGVPAPPPPPPPPDNAKAFLESVVQYRVSKRQALVPPHSGDPDGVGVPPDSESLSSSTGSRPRDAQQTIPPGASKKKLQNPPLPLVETSRKENGTKEVKAPSTTICVPYVTGIQVMGSAAAVEKALKIHGSDVVDIIQPQLKSEDEALATVRLIMKRTPASLSTNSALMEAIMSSFPEFVGGYFSE